MYQVTLQIKSDKETRTITGLFGFPSDVLEPEKVGEIALKNAIRDEILKTNSITVTGVVLAVRKIEVEFWYSPRLDKTVSINNEN